MNYYSTMKICGDISGLLMMKMHPYLFRFPVSLSYDKNSLFFFPFLPPFLLFPSQKNKTRFYVLLGKGLGFDISFSFLFYFI
jgi:hypothetical protein